MKLSVLLFDFDGESFMDESIRSVLGQRTEFDFELVVGEYWSTDATRVILDRLEAENPQRLRVVRRAEGSDRPVGVADAYARCAGEYLALMEGDDYWIDPRKLQRQVDWLDAHPGHAFCFHDVTTLSPDQSESGRVIRAPASASGNANEFHLADLFRARFVPGGSIVLRRDMVGRLPEWLERCGRVDWLLTLLAARHGPFSRLFGCSVIRRGKVGGSRSAVDDLSESQLAEQEYGLLKSALPQSAWPLLDAKLEAIDIRRRKAWCVETVQNFVAIERRWVEEDAKLRAYVSRLEALVQEAEQRRAALSRRLEQASRSPGLARK